MTRVTCDAYEPRPCGLPRTPSYWKEPEWAASFHSEDESRAVSWITVTSAVLPGRGTPVVGEMVALPAYLCVLSRVVSSFLTNPSSHGAEQYVP